MLLPKKVEMQNIANAEECRKCPQGYFSNSALARLKSFGKDTACDMLLVRNWVALFS